MIKKICVLIAALMLISLLPGCYDRREVDDLAYVVAIGIDKGKVNNIRMTLQIAIPTAIAGGGGGGSEGGGEAESKSVTIVSVESPSILSGLNMLNTSISKQINLSHAKVIIISKELASEGIGKYAMGLPRLRELRPNIFLMITRETAEDYIRSVNPKLVGNPAKYFEEISAAYTYTGFTANTQFFDFFKRTKASYIQPVATLAGVSKFKSGEDLSIQYSTYKEKGKPYPFEGDFKAGDIPIASKEKSEVMGLAVFDGAKMVGELDGDEATHYTMVTGEYRNANITAQDPLDKSTIVILSVKKSRDSIYKVEMVNGNPNIFVKVILEADIMGVQSGINYEEDGKRELLEQAYENMIKEGIMRLLNRTAKEFKSDIFGFGREAKKKYLTWQEWEDFNWLGRYKDSTFTVDVDMKIRRPGLLLRSMPVISEEGEQKP